MIKDGPFKTALECEGRTLIKEEYVSYEIKDGVLIKTTTTRTHFNDGDYNDSTRSEPLCKGEKFESQDNQL